MPTLVTDQVETAVDISAKKEISFFFIITACWCCPTPLLQRKKSHLTNAPVKDQKIYSKGFKKNTLLPIFLQLRSRQAAD